MFREVSIFPYSILYVIFGRLQFFGSQVASISVFWLLVLGFLAVIWSIFLSYKEVEYYIRIKKYPLHLLRRYLVLGSSVSIISIDTLPANLSNA